MEHWIKCCLRLGQTKGYLTYTEVNDHMPDDEVDPDRFNELLLLLEEENIELRDESTPSTTGTPITARLPEILFHKFTPELLEGWKSYPVRIRGPHPSGCHSTPTLLVQSMKGGFVTANCAECGKKHLLSQSGFLSLFLWVSCPRCRMQMRADMLSRVSGLSRLAKNYGYVCSRCHIYILLADLLPRWEDLE